MTDLPSGSSEPPPRVFSHLAGAWSAALRRAVAAAVVASMLSVAFVVQPLVAAADDAVVQPETAGSAQEVDPAVSRGVEGADEDADHGQDEDEGLGQDEASDLGTAEGEEMLLPGQPGEATPGAVAPGAVEGAPDQPLHEEAADDDVLLDELPPTVEDVPVAAVDAGSFNGQLGSRFNEFLRVVEEDAQGRVLVGGAFTGLAGDLTVPNYLMRLHPDGSPDEAFNANLDTGLDNFVNDIAVAPDGGVIDFGYFTALSGSSAIPNRVLRLNADGTLDAAFNANLGSGFDQEMWAVDIDAEGRVLLGGNFTTFSGSNAVPNRLLRLNADGTLDQDFNARLGSGLTTAVREITPTSTGQHLVGGVFSTLDGSAIANNLLRLNPDGTYDAEFRTALGTGFNGTVWAAEETSDGDILVGGEFTTMSGSASIPDRMVRLHADGSLAAEFNAALGSGFNSSVYTVLPTSGGGIMAGGDFTTFDGNSAATPNRVMMLNPDGTRNVEFNARELGTGVSSTVWSIKETRVSGGGYLVGGVFAATGSKPRSLFKLEGVSLLPDPDVAPEIVSPAAGDVFLATGLVHGSGTPGAELVLSAGGDVLGRATVNERGDWLFRVPEALTEGTWVVEATQDGTDLTDSVSVEVLGHTMVAWGAGEQAHGLDEVSPGDRVVQAASSLGGPVTTAAVTDQGRLLAWGPDGALDPAGLAAGMPSGLVQVSPGDGFVLGLTADGRAVVAGSSTSGVLDVPAALQAGGVVAVEAGADTAYALLADGTVVAWVSGDHGQTVLPGGLADQTVVQLSAGTDHAMALSATGTVVAWGGSGSGQTTVPASVEGSTTVQVSAGAHLSVALDQTGAVSVWGLDGDELVAPEQARGTARQVDAGVGSIVAVARDGSIAAWGPGAAGWTEVSEEVDRAVVVQVVAGTTYGAVLVDRVVVLDPPDASVIDHRPVVSGSGSPETVVTVRLEHEDSVVELLAEVGSDGLWSVQPGSDIAPGTYTIVARSSAGAHDTVSVRTFTPGPPSRLVVTPRATHVQNLAAV